MVWLRYQWCAAEFLLKLGRWRQLRLQQGGAQDGSARDVGASYALQRKIMMGCNCGLPQVRQASAHLHPKLLLLQPRSMHGHFELTTTEARTFVRRAQAGSEQEVFPSSWPSEFCSWALVSSVSV